MSNDSPFNRGSRLDRAIDRAVHEMVRRDPPQSLRRRVLAEIARQPQRPTWRPRFALAVGTLAMVVLAALYLRPDAPVRVTTPDSLAVAMPRPTAPATVTPTAQSVPPPVSAPPLSARRARGSDTLIRTPPVPNVFGSRADQAMGASVESLQIDTLATADLGSGEAPGAIVPRPLQSRAIVVAPLEQIPLHIPPIPR